MAYSVSIVIITMITSRFTIIRTIYVSAQPEKRQRFESVCVITNYDDAHINSHNKTDKQRFVD